MTLLTGILNACRKYLLSGFVAAPIQASAPQREPVLPSPARSSSPPAAPAVSAPPQRLTAVDILRKEPNVSAAELAERAGVTLSYASTLVRKRRPRALAAAAPAPARPSRVPLESGTDRMKIQIMAAASGGMSVAKIAEQYSVVPGEVEFALKLARLANKP